MPSDSKKSDSKNGHVPTTSGNLSFSVEFELDASTVIHEVIGKLSTAEKWFSPCRLDLSLAAFLKDEKFLGRPSLKELGLGLRLH